MLFVCKEYLGIYIKWVLKQYHPKHIVKWTYCDFDLRYVALQSANEPPMKPYLFDQITKELKAVGIQIASNVTQCIHSITLCFLPRRKQKNNYVVRKDVPKSFKMGCILILSYKISSVLKNIHSLHLILVKSFSKIWIIKLQFKKSLITSYLYIFRQSKIYKGHKWIT